MDATPYITNRVIINSELMKKIKKTTVGEAIFDISLYTIDENVHCEKISSKHNKWGELDFHPDLVLIKQYLRRSNLLDTIFPNKE